MEKILLILTGGTIGSFSENGIISAYQPGQCSLLSLYNQKYGYSNVSFDVRQPFNILSENLSVHYWEILVNYILDIEFDKYDGIIIAHGSDTLSYTSAMLSMCLRYTTIPIIITASDLVPDNPKSNALNNLDAAIQIIKTHKPGIFTVFKNNDNNMTNVYIPTRINEADRITDCFSAFGGKKLASVIYDEIILDSSIDLYNDISKPKTRLFENYLQLKKQVLIVQPYPSINYENIKIDENTGAVLHITYHSATVPTEGENSALTFLQRCHDMGIDMFVCSFKRNTDIYETSNLLIKNGAIPIYNVSKESAYAKLLLAVNIFSQDIIKFMSENIYYEEIEF